MTVPIYYEAAISGRYTAAQLMEGIPVVINGITVIVRGTIVGGVGQLGTAYIQ